MKRMVVKECGGNVCGNLPSVMLWGRDAMVGLTRAGSSAVLVAFRGAAVARQGSPAASLALSGPWGGASSLL